MKDLRDCRGCRRLTRNLDQLRIVHPDWHNGPVPAIGPVDATLLILGLAPGRMGANRTGKPFVGDRSSEWLTSRLREAELMNRDGQPINTRISNAVKCLPPQNRPTINEIQRCVRRWLTLELHQSSVVLALGKVAHDAVLRGLNEPLANHQFAHGSVHKLNALTLVDSFHPSPLNTQTGRLSVSDFSRVLEKAKKMAQEPH